MAVAAVCLASLPAPAQYPGQINPHPKNEPILRAVVVVEWTGSLEHPTASRVIPISLWDGTTLQDAGIYLARPEPLALQSETEYVLQKDGRQDGLFDISEAANQGGGWIGFGKWRPLPKGPTPAELARERAKMEIVDDYGASDEPVLHRKHHPGDAKTTGNNKAGTAASNAPPPDPNRPHLGSDDSSSDTANNAPPPDPNRPHLAADNGPAPSKPQKSQAGQNVAYVSDLPNLPDPDRPHLAYGKPVNYQGPDVKPIAMGLPPDMHQEVGISDVRKILNHPWDYTWANPADALKMKADLEQIARKDLGLDQPPVPAPSSKSRRSTKSRKAAPPPQPPPPALLEGEQFRVLELAYGDGATMVFSAHTKGAGAGEKFITLIAQPDLYGGVMVLFKNVTDADRLDLTPRMRLVDAVDAKGNNRGDLLFELRGKIQREFALFRVVRGQATQLFITSPTGGGSPE